MTDSIRILETKGRAGQTAAETGASRPVSSPARIRHRSSLTRSRREALIDLLYLAPQYILYLSVLVLPFLIALPIVFTDQLDFLDSDIDYVGLENITSLFRYPMVDLFLPALRRTLIFTFTSYFMLFLFGFLLALAMYELTSRLKGFFFTIIYMPWMISGVSIGLLMIMLFSRDTGNANLAMEAAGLGRNVFDAKTEAATIYALPFIYGWKTAGFNMALFLGGLLAIPKETIESAKLDGANYVQRVAYIYVPQMAPAIITASIFALINGFGLFDELVGLGGLSGNSNARFLSILIYELGFAGSQNYGAKVGTLAQGITVSLVVFVPLVVIAYFLTRLQKRLQYH